MDEFHNAKSTTTNAPPRTWILQRLEVEQSNIEPVPSAEVGATTLGTDGYQTQEAGADGY